MAGEYQRGKTLAQVGLSLGISGPAVRKHLIRMGIPMRRRGGNFINPGIRTVGSFLIECRACRKEFTGGSWMAVLAELKGHRC
ncbi:MAG: hypothetical protein Q8P24_02510 [Desulfobacterales bacterium]|nr:hypothetical protein [Desulfobacterales bacterium]